MKFVRDVEKFARRHKKALWWSAGVAGGGLLLYLVTRAPAPAYSIRALKYTGPDAPPQFLDQQLAALQLVLKSAQASGNAAYAASTQQRIAAVQAKIAYLNSPQGLIDSVNATSWLLGTGYAAMTNGNVVLMNADTFRKIFTHQGTKVLDLVSSIFYPKGMCAQFGDGTCSLFSTDEVANHEHCQTSAAQVVGLGNDWVAPFYNAVYRYPSPNPNYAGNPIDPHTDPGGFENARQQAVEAAVSKAETAADFGDAMDNWNKVLGVTGAPQIGTLYTITVSNTTRDRLAQLARDMLAKNKIAIPTTDGQGNAIQEPQLTMLHASIGAGIVAHLIDAFESSDPKVNPCIRELTPELVFQMFAATLGVVIGLAIGPALSGIGVALQVAATVQKLASLSK